jgi:hypothetical protein
MRECNEEVIKAEEKRLVVVVEREFFKNAYQHEAKLYKALEKAYNRLQRRIGGVDQNRDDADWWKET